MTIAKYSQMFALSFYWTKKVGNASIATKICRKQHLLYNGNGNIRTNVDQRNRKFFNLPPKKSKLATMLFPLIQFLLSTGSSSPKRFKNRRTWGRYRRSDKFCFLTVRSLVLCVLHGFAAHFTKFTSKLGSLSRICLITLPSFSESS